jgi:predicted outer membrane repeat protein
LGDGGGAIRHTGGILDVSGCTFRNNFAALDPGSGGGGAIVSSLSEVDRVISNSVFTDNGAEGPGGALWLLHGQGVVTYTVNGCRFESNYATSGGAIEAVAVGSNATLRINRFHVCRQFGQCARRCLHGGFSQCFGRPLHIQREHGAHGRRGLLSREFSSDKLHLRRAIQPAVVEAARFSTRQSCVRKAARFRQ